MGNGLVGAVGGILISHFTFTPSVKRHSIKEGKHLDGASGLGTGTEGNTKQNIKTPFVFLFMGYVEASSVGGNPILQPVNLFSFFFRWIEMRINMKKEVDVVIPVDLVGGQGGDEILVFHNPLDHHGSLG